MTMTVSGYTAVVPEFSPEWIDKALATKVRRVSCRKYRGLFLQASRDRKSGSWTFQDNGVRQVVGRYPEIQDAEGALHAMNSTGPEARPLSPAQELIRRAW